MKTLFRNLCITVLLATAASGCSAIQQAKEKHLLGDARQIASARLVMLTNNPDNRVPTLQEITAEHPLLDADRIAPFETTPDWANPKAGKKMILRQKDPVRGRRVVLFGDGAAVVTKE